MAASGAASVSSPAEQVSTRQTPAPTQGRVSVVKATFLSHSTDTLEGLLEGFTTMRVLTYSSSLPILHRTAELIDDLEVVFGREDIIGGFEKYMYFQELLLKELTDLFHVKGRAEVKQKIEQGKLRFRVLKDSISHQKLFLLSGPKGTRVITGSGNFSDRAFSGIQHENFTCYDNDEGAWQHYSQEYEKIKAASSLQIDKQAILSDGFQVEQLPLLQVGEPGNGLPEVMLLDTRPPQPNIITKVLEKTPKRYAGISSLLSTEKGIARLVKATVLPIVQYVKSHLRTEEENPTEQLRIIRETGQVLLAGQPLDLHLDPAAVKQDVETLYAYFEGFTHFLGDSARLQRDYFTFMSWLFVSPFLCDFRHYANRQNGFIYDYPLFGILYGKSNCGKSELVRTLQLAMFGYEGFLDKEWFTKSNVAQFREQNKRFPLVFDDLDNTRFTNHAIALIKEDYPRHSEYPAVVLSMNADRDTFESEVRKRCLIIYTDASLPDHTGQSRELALTIKKLKARLGTALYREFLRRTLKQLEQENPADVLAFSSGILHTIFAEYLVQVPDWCYPVTMQQYSQVKHDKIKNELLEILKYNEKAWSVKGEKVTLKLDLHSAKKLAKDIPDYLISLNRGEVIIFKKKYLEKFLERPVRYSFWHKLSQWAGK